MKNKCTQILRVTEKLNNTGSVDGKFLIVKSRYATQWLQEFISGGIFLNLSRGGET